MSRTGEEVGKRVGDEGWEVGRGEGWGGGGGGGVRLLTDQTVMEGYEYMQQFSYLHDPEQPFQFFMSWYKYFASL